jgi:hypothetical protein
MHRLKNRAAVVLGLLFAGSVQAVPVNFNYSQTDATTGAGSIAAFTLSDPGGDISFSATPMPAATVVNPGPAGFVGSQTVAAGAANEANTAVGLAWSGSVTAVGTRGGDFFTIQIPFRFIPKQTQTPDINDYTWNLAYGDDVAGGTDTVSTSMRFAMWLSRDDLVNGAETPDTFQRYTQQNHTFVAGASSFTNTDTTTTAIKDATDPAGAPAGVDAAGRNLAFYFGWRDQGALTTGAVLVDTFTVGGLLDADVNSLRLVPEPSSLLGLAGMAMLGLTRRRRA